MNRRTTGVALATADKRRSSALIWSRIEERAFISAIKYDAERYKQRNRIERMFGRLKDWRRIATRYDRCAHTFMSAICIAATVIFWS